MAEFYWQPSFGHGGESRSSEPLPKEKSLLEKSLDEVQSKADAVLRDALALAKSGSEQDKEKIEERIQVYKQLTSIIPGGFDEARVTDIRKHFEYHHRLAEFEKQLKKDIFS